MHDIHVIIIQEVLSSCKDFFNLALWWGILYTFGIAKNFFPHWKWIVLIVIFHTLDGLNVYMYEDVYITKSDVSICMQSVPPTWKIQRPCGTLCKVVSSYRPEEYEIYEQQCIDGDTPNWVLVKSSKESRGK